MNSRLICFHIAITTQIVILPPITTFGFHWIIPSIQTKNFEPHLGSDWNQNLPVQKRFQIVKEREVGVRSVRDGLVAPEPPPSRHVVIKHPIVATLGDPSAVGLVLTAEQLAERPDLLYHSWVCHRHGHGSHKRRAGGGRGRRGRCGRRSRRLLLLCGRIFFIGCPRFRRRGRCRSAAAAWSGWSVCRVQRFGRGDHCLGFDAHHMTFVPQRRTCKQWLLLFYYL